MKKERGFPIRPVPVEVKPARVASAGQV